jgi:hypothetical protein
MKKKRKEVSLTPMIVKFLTKLAEKDDRKLKPYMEKVLTKHAMDNAHKFQVK